MQFKMCKTFQNPFQSKSNHYEKRLALRVGTQWPAKNNLGMSKNRSLQWIKILSEEAVLFLSTSDFTGYLQEIYFS